MISRPLVSPELLTVTRNPWDSAVQWMLGVLLAFMPLAFGAVDPWSELIAIALAAAVSLCVLIRASIDRSFQLPWTWAYLPLAAWVLLILFQLAPLPRGLTGILSPESTRVRTEFLGEASSGSSTPISLYPLATAHGLRLVLVGCAVFFVVVSAIRSAAQIKRLLLIVFVIGCAEAGLALLQIITRAKGLYWLFDPGTGRLTSGSFINYSNFSQFMNLSIGAGLALLLVRLQKERHSSSRSSSPSRPFDGARMSEHGGLIVGLILCAVAILASLSRNGAISLAAAGLAVGAGLFARGTLSRRGWVLAILPLGALVVLFATSFDAVYERMATLQQTGLVAGRWEITHGTLRAWMAYPIWGAGLGTHEYVFPMFDVGTSAYFAGHADNDYAQLLEETGLAGAVCVLAFLAIVGRSFYRLCRRGRSSLSAAAFGLTFGLIAVAIHSASDFGQHIPAVFCLSAVFSGLALQLVRNEWPASEPVITPDRSHLSLWPVRVAAAAVAVGWAWILNGAFAAHVGEQWWAAAQFVDSDIQKDGSAATDQQFSDLLAAVEQAVANQPANVEYGYWLNLYRWRALARVVDPGTGATMLDGAAKPLVARIADELADVRRLCPTYGPPYGLEGQLRLAVLGDDTGRQLIQKGVRLAPYDGPTCLIAGELAVRERRIAEAVALLRRTLDLAPQLYLDVVTIVLFEMGDEQLARELAGDDYKQLQSLADIADGREAHREFAEEMRGEAEKVLRQLAAGDDATSQELAILAGLEFDRKNYKAAAPLYQRALTLQYNQLPWRIALAQSLMAMGENNQAMREARRCLRQAPSNETVNQLIRELSLLVDE